MVLNEAAVTVDQARSDGMALMIFRGTPMVTHYILYDAKQLMRNIKETKSGLRAIVMTGVTALITVQEKALAGDPDTPCWNSREVLVSYAEKGYGPLMYDIAMADGDGRPLISDRNKVSTSARQVWDFYYKKRSDVKKKKLDDYQNPQTPEKIDDCMVQPHIDQLNYAYELTKRVPFQKLVKFHDTVKTAILEMGTGGIIDIEGIEEEKYIDWAWWGLGQQTFQAKFPKGAD